MALKKLLEDEALQELLENRLANGERYELICLNTEEIMTFEQLKKEIL